MLYILGVFFSYFLSVIILSKKGRNQADIILGIWMLVIGVHLLDFYCFISGIINKYPSILWVNFSLPFLHGPLLFLYTLSLTSKTTIKWRQIFPHFVVPLFILALYFPFLFFSYEKKVAFIFSEGKGLEIQSFLFTSLLNISGIVYIITTYLLLKKHKKSILNEFSYQEKIDLNWLQMLFLGMTMMWIFIIIIKNDTLIFSASTVFVIFIGFYGIKQTRIFNNNQLVIDEQKENIVETLWNIATEERKKYAKSGLSEEASTALHQKLLELMISEKLYTEPELNLSDLANRLNIHPNYLSQVINEIEGVNFYDYINTLRIAEFKRLVALPENQKYTLLALAFDCGFNSKSAFNRFFKKSTGLSPSQYLASQK